MWGKISLQWHLLRHHLWNLGSGYNAGREEELLILNRSNQRERRCQGLSLAPFLLAGRVELGKYKKGVPNYGHYGRCDEFRG